MARCARTQCRKWRPDLLARHGRSGVRLDGEWYCSAVCLEADLRRRLKGSGRLHPHAVVSSIPPLKLGVLLLVNQSAITPALLHRALDEQRHTGLRIGAQLQRMGLVSSHDVLRALAAQSGVSYLTQLDPTRLSQAPGSLSRDTVRALGLVPFEASLEERRLKVACTAPVPRLAITALHELTGWTAEPYLVGDDQWPALLDAYGSSAPPASPRAASATVRNMTDATARIARAVEQERDVRLTHAHFDPYLWVRLEGAEKVEDLLLTVAEQPPEEDPWQLARTSH